MSRILTGDTGMVEVSERKRPSLLHEREMKKKVVWTRCSAHSVVRQQATIVYVTMIRRTKGIDKVKLGASFGVDGAPSTQCLGSAMRSVNTRSSNTSMLLPTVPAAFIRMQWLLDRIHRRGRELSRVHGHRLLSVRRER